MIFNFTIICTISLLLTILSSNGLPGDLFGASIGGLACFFFPRLDEKLLDFFG